MKEVHSYWAYLVLAVLVITVVNAIVGYTSKKEFKDKDLRLGLFYLDFFTYTTINRIRMVLYVTSV